MVQNFIIEGLRCMCCKAQDTDKIAYILYPADMLSGWIEAASRNYGVTIVVITGMDWQNVFSPWPAPGVPAGSSDFKGESPEFLHTLCQVVIPQVETALGISATPERTLTGVSMSGLFALWQWMVCGVFHSIASLSGSFWYQGFMEWMLSQPIPHKEGEAFFLLGKQEAKSPVKAFEAISANTRNIVQLLEDKGIRVRFEMVPGNHYANPVPRLDASFSALYKCTQDSSSTSKNVG